MGKQQAEEILIPTSEALEIVKTRGIAPISLPTIINWARAYKIGKKVGGKFYIDKRKLIDMLEMGNPDE